MCVHINIVCRWICNLFGLHFLSSITLPSRVNYCLICLLLLQVLFSIHLTLFNSPKFLILIFKNQTLTDVKNTSTESNTSSCLLDCLLASVPGTQTDCSSGPLHSCRSGILLTTLCWPFSEKFSLFHCTYSFGRANQALEGHFLRTCLSDKH